MITTRRMSSHQETESCHMWTNIVSPPGTTSQKLIGSLGETQLLAGKPVAQLTANQTGGRGHQVQPYPNCHNGRKRLLYAQAVKAGDDHKKNCDVWSGCSPVPR